MSRPLFVDTAFVFALLNERDSYHRIACKLSADFKAHTLLTTDAVLLEIGNALVKGFKQEAIEVIEKFLASEDVEIVHFAFDLEIWHDRIVSSLINIKFPFKNRSYLVVQPVVLCHGVCEKLKIYGIVCSYFRIIAVKIVGMIFEVNAR